MSIIFLLCPFAVLSSLAPILESIKITVSRRLDRIRSVEHPTPVACRLLLELSIHVLPAIPVLLSTSSQSFAAVDPHDMTCHLSCTVVNEKQLVPVTRN